jgi:lipoprotein-anchoring transpeptidase ErfK/SrfK
VRRGGWFSNGRSKRLIGAAAVGVLLTCGVVVSVIVGGASRLSETRHTTAATSAAGPQPTSNATEVRSTLASALSFVPAPGATAVAPDAPIVVRAGAGHLAAVHVSSSNGLAVAGGLSQSADEWHSSGSLAYGATYHVTATVAAVAGEAQVRAQSTATFQTLSPPAGVTASVFPSAGLAVGVAQPVVFRFSQEITSEAARSSLLMHLSVTESRPVIGGWHWFSNRELHFRPKSFWPTGDHITVDWNLTGWNAGGGAWGAGSGTIPFTIGHARVSYADLATHVMTVTDNGRVIATFPISGGKAADPTMGGVHIVLDRESVVHMVSSTNGIPVNSPDGYDELVYEDVHISDTGEYVHAAPWSVASQGRSNVSHGCINLSPQNAKDFFDFSRVGDVVVVTGSPRPPVVGDHGVMDWDTGWAAFAPANVIVQPPMSLPSLY